MAAQVLSGIAEQVSAVVLAKDANALSPEAAAICESLAAEPLWISDEAGFQDDSVLQALEADLIIDAVAGTEFKPPLKGVARKAVEAVDRLQELLFQSAYHRELIRIVMSRCMKVAAKQCLRML